MSLTTQRVLEEQENAFAGRAQWLKERGLTEKEVAVERDFDHMLAEYVITSKRKLRLPEKYQLIYGALQ